MPSWLGPSSMGHRPSRSGPPPLLVHACVCIDCIVQESLHCTSSIRSWKQQPEAKWCMNGTNSTIRQLIETRVKFRQHISGRKKITQLLNQDPKTLGILNMEINVSHTYIYERLKKHVRSFFSNLLIPLWGRGWLESPPDSQGTGWGTGKGALWPLGTITHTHTHWDNGDTPIHLTCISLGCKRKLESPEETHTELGRMCKLHTHIAALAGNSFFSPQHYNETVLSEGLL